MPDLYNMDELLAKSFAGESLPEEDAVIRRWLESDPANPKYMDELRQVWDNTPAANPASATYFDTERALQAVKSRMHATGAGKGPWPLYYRRWLAAAAALFVIAAAWYFLKPPGEAGPVQIVSSDAPLSDTLQDGSRVWLNRNSGLQIVQGDMRKSRKIRLSGEAYFEVRHDAERPFRVEIGGLEISVLGTAFNVDNRTDTARVTVTVSEGVVRLSGGRQVEILRAGGAAVFLRAENRIERLQAPDPNVLAYQNRRFVFDGAPLGKVVRQLEAVYGIRIELRNPVLADCRLTARYAGMEPERILELIADSFSLELGSQDGVFYLDGPGCGGE